MTSFSMLHPDVELTEINLSQYVSSTAATVGVAVGGSNQGPYEDIYGTLSLNYYGDSKSFIDRFGLPNPSSSYLHYTVLPAMETMKSIYVNRVLGSNYAYAGIISTASGTTSLTGGTAWATSTAYSEGDIRSTSTGNYVCTTAGTSASSGTGPATTGGGIVDGTVAWDYAGGASPLASFDFSVYTGSLMLFTAENPGTWGNSLKIQITNVSATAHTFDIKVWQTVSGVDILREQFTGCSRRQYNNDGSAYLDGFGRSRYVMTRINGQSAYLKVVDNTAIADTTDPAATSATSLTGGLNGAAVTSGQIINIWNSQFSNADTVKINLLLNAGYVTNADQTVQQAMLSIATARRDCFVVLDVPSDLTSASTIVTWRNSTQNINSSYCALYAPWVLVYDSYNDIQKVAVPPSGFVGQVMARTDRSLAQWYAPAGLYSGGIGVITSSILPVQGLAIKFSNADQDLLYSNQVNYFRQFYGSGTVLWGQKTQSTETSALDRVNVRRLLIYIETAMLGYLRNVIFSLNTVFTRSQVVNALSQFLETVKAQQGLYDYKVVCNTSNNTAQVIDNNYLVVDVYVKPTKSAEFIKLNLIITSTGADLVALSSAGTPV